MAAFPPFTFAGQGNISITPPPGTTVPGSQLDANFAACAPLIGPTYYPQGSLNGVALALVATQNGAADDLLSNVDWASVSSGTLTALFNAMKTAGLFNDFVSTQ